MDAVEHIKKTITHDDLIRIMKHYDAQHINIYNDTLKCCCPIHYGDNKIAFVMNLNTTLWYCFTQCKIGGDIFSLICIKENCLFEESILFLANFLNINIDNMEIVYKETDIMSETIKWIEKSKKNVKQEPNLQYDLSDIGELFSINSYRNFTKEKLTQFGIKYSQKYRRVVFPIYENNILVGVSMRRTEDEGVKWLHKPKGIKTGTMLYNYDNVETNSTVIICEGMPDVINLTQLGYKNVVATFGSHLGDVQARLILLKTYKVILMYDPDKAGILGTISAIKTLSTFVNIRIANLACGKDAGELTTEEADEAINNNLSVKQWKELYAK